MSDEKRYTEKTEVKTETSGSSPVENTYKKETTVKTEKKVEKDDDPIIIIENK